MYKKLREAVEAVKNEKLADDVIYDEITEDAAEDVVIGDDVDEIPMGAIEQDIDNDTEESLNDEIKEAELKESYTL
jgi:hypothetical protein|nr:MAG TPA: hypothetical protein [Caudoviricetes sp.]